MHEASLYDDNAFITLTYAPEKLPYDGSLNLPHWQEFMKRLRWHNRSTRIRFYHCGEYGEDYGRPHYHAILFNYDFSDKKFWKKNKQGDPLYTSEELTDIWGLGHCSTGAVTFESAAYVARYVTKKVVGKDAPDHYMRLNETGETYWLKPEYTTMSRRPGIGAGWYEKFSDEVFPDDFVIVNGKKCKPPRYYLDILRNCNEISFDSVIKDRLKYARDNAEEHTRVRLDTREEVREAMVKGLTRNLESH